MYYWYKFFTYLFLPFSPLYLYLRKIKKKEDPDRYLEKLSKISLQRGDGFLIWFHVASVGELISILPLIEHCINQKKINKILITSITLSSGNLVKKKFINFPKINHQFLPLDIPIFTNKFLDHWKPNLSIFVDSEIWPNLILQASKKKIPLLLVNGRITKKSFVRWRFIISFAKKIFGKFNLCIASNKESEDFLKILGAKNIKNFGNLKFSGSKVEVKKLDLNFLDKIQNKKIWCAASTHPNEEIICAKSHIKIKEKFSEVLTIIIPRHINRVKEINKNLVELNLKIVFSSKLNELDKETDILLVDSYGDSLKFYNISKYVFLGKSLIKSLIKDGGQNPIEPAKLGCKILHGPNVSNFTEIYEYLSKYRITKEINNSEELGMYLIEEFKEDKPRNYESSKKIEIHGKSIFDNVIKEINRYT